jgi:hypothetical protein
MFPRRQGSSVYPHPRRDLAQSRQSDPECRGDGAKGETRHCRDSEPANGPIGSLYLARAGDLRRLAE